MKLLPDVVGDRIELSPLKYQPRGGSQYRLKLAEQLDLSSQPNFCGEVTNQDIGALKVSRIVIGTLFLIIFSHCNYYKLDNSDHQFTASIFIKWVASSF